MRCNALIEKVSPCVQTSRVLSAETREIRRRQTQSHSASRPIARPAAAGASELYASRAGRTAQTGHGASVDRLMALAEPTLRPPHRAGGTNDHAETNATAAKKNGSEKKKNGSARPLVPTWPVLTGLIKAKLVRENPLLEVEPALSRDLLHSNRRQARVRWMQHTYVPHYRWTAACVATRAGTPTFHA
eukprot:SAG31_NODE_434_length_15737_cov_10.315450_10_plen_188_part_00